MTAVGAVTRTAVQGSPLRAMTDAELVSRVLAGEVEAYAGLVTRYRDRYVRYAWRMLGDADEAEDVLQEAFVRAYRSLDRCEDPARFGSWLLSILVNRCRTAAARRIRRARAEADPALVRPSAEQPVERRAWREAIERALVKLDPVSREAFLLKYVENLEYQDMARITGVGVSALKMRVKRACARLRAELEDAP
jgi:RNA polymerase sigma-70 factor, ECF subfamily